MYHMQHVLYDGLAILTQLSNKSVQWLVRVFARGYHTTTVNFVRISVGRKVQIRVVI